MAALGERGPAEQGARRVERMVARHGAALLRVANQFSLCHDDALDAYQRALEIYLRRLDSVDPATEGAWLRVVVKHEAMAIRRARQESVDREDVDLDASLPAGLREVEDEVAGGERVERSVEALRALKPDEARALLLKAEGLSYQEIGRRFGWTYTKVNRSIAEGRARFLKVFNGIEAGEACEAHESALSALAAGTATSAQVVSIRPHLRHCACCRATVREMRFSRTRRLALFLPFGWLARLLARGDVNAGMQYAASTGGGRLGPAATLIGLCLSGVGAGAACMVTGALPPPPLIAHVRPEAGSRSRPSARRRRRRRRRPSARSPRTPTRSPPRRLRPPRPARRSARSRRSSARRRTRRSARRTRARRSSASRATAPVPARPRRRRRSRAARACGGGGGGSVDPPRSAPSGPAGSEFSFEGG